MLSQVCRGGMFVRSYEVEGYKIGKRKEAVSENTTTTRHGNNDIVRCTFKVCLAGYAIRPWGCKRVL